MRRYFSEVLGTSFLLKLLRKSFAMLAAGFVIFITGFARAQDSSPTGGSMSNFLEDASKDHKSKDYYLNNIKKRISCAKSGEITCEEEIAFFIASWIDDHSMEKNPDYTIDHAIYLVRKSIREYRKIDGVRHYWGFSTEILGALYYKGLYGFPKDDKVPLCYTQASYDGAKHSFHYCEQLELKKYPHIPMGKRPAWLD